MANKRTETNAAGKEDSQRHMLERLLLEQQVVNANLDKLMLSITDKLGEALQPQMEIAAALATRLELFIHRMEAKDEQLALMAQANIDQTRNYEKLKAELERVFRRIEALKKEQVMQLDALRKQHDAENAVFHELVAALQEQIATMQTALVNKASTKQTHV